MCISQRRIAEPPLFRRREVRKKADGGEEVYSQFTRRTGSSCKGSMERQAELNAPGTLVVHSPKSPFHIPPCIFKILTCYKLLLVTLLLFFVQSLWCILAIYAVKCSIYHSNNFGWQNREALKNIFYERK